MSEQRFNIEQQYREKFYKLPKVFFTIEKYMQLSNDAKIAYTLLKDRLELSIKNNWFDDNGDIFFIFTNEKLKTILNCHDGKLTKIKKELSKANLLEQVRCGQGRPNKLYLMNPEVTKEDIYEINKQEEINEETSDDAEMRKSHNKKCENRISRNAEIAQQEMRKSHTNDTDFSNTEFNETELSDTTTTENQNTSGSGDTQYIIQTIEKEFNIKMTTLYKKQIVELLYNFDKEVIEYAIEYASIHGNNPKSFLLQILKNWKQNNIKTITEAKGYKVPKNKNVTPLEITPQWLLDRKEQEQTDNYSTKEDEEINEEHEKKRAEFLEHLKERWDND